MLNALFAQSNENEVHSYDFDFTHFSNESKYMCSNEMDQAMFKGSTERVSKNFPVLSLNIRSIVKRDNFTKFEAFLESSTVKPKVIAISETWTKENQKEEIGAGVN